MKIKGAIFDCDGTLIASLGFWEVFYEKAGEYYFKDKNFRPSVEDDKAMRTQNAAFIAETLSTKYKITESKEAILKRVLDICEWYYREVVQLKTGVRELLAHLKKQGVKMCIASAAETNLIKVVLGKHGILDYFEGIISCTEVGAGKDKPDVFIAAEKFLATPREQTWVFEDSLLAAQTAKAAGYPVVGVYDALGFGQAQLRELSDEFIEEDESFVKLTSKIDEK